MNADIELRENIIGIKTNDCWMCGSNTGLTEHHILPRYLKPIKNVKIPLCEDCHKKLHGNDTNCLKAFCYKISNSFRKGMRELDSLKGLVSRKQKQDDEFTIGDLIKNGGIK